MNLPVLIGVLSIGIVLLFSVVLAFSRRSRKRRAPRSKDRQATVAAANRALAQNPRDAQALSVLADVYYSDQEWEKAARTYALLTPLVAMNPGLDEHLMNVRHGLASVQIEDFENGYKSLTLARKGHEDDFEINSNLGQIEVRRKNYERAVALLRAAIEKRPDHPGTIRSLGHAYYRIKRPKEAISLLRKIAEIQPDDRESIFVLGQAYFEAGQSDQAIRVFTHLRADPVYGPKAALMSGSLHLKARSYDAAEMDFKIGLKHQGIQPEVLLELKYRLAATYTRQQNIEEALRELEEISRINPQYKDVSAQLSHSRELAGNRNLQVFLIATTSEFIGLCRRIVGNYFPKSNVKITDIGANRNEYTDILAEVSTAKWEDTVLFRFVRSNSAVGELVLRDLYSRTKEVHAGRGLCICAGTFSEGAIAFVEARLIDLVDKDGLEKLLKRV